MAKNVKTKLKWHWQGKKECPVRNFTISPHNTVLKPSNIFHFSHLTVILVVCEHSR